MGGNLTKACYQFVTTNSGPRPNGAGPSILSTFSTIQTLTLFHYPLSKQKIEIRRHGMALAKARTFLGLAVPLLMMLGWTSFCVAETHNLVIVMDGLRPDYVTPELMPKLETWSKSGVICLNHHSVFPTVTRVNSSSFSTGAYPRKHGLLANAVFFPSISANKGIDTGDRKNLLRIDQETGGHLLTVPTLAEYLSEKGKRFLAVSCGSSGSATLLNPKGAGDGIIHFEFSLPDSRLGSVIDAIGKPPEGGLPNLALNHWAVDACLKFGFEKETPEVVFLWLSDPDHTAHKAGIGSALTNQALSALDEEFARILSTLESRQQLSETNILVVSDHGFSTHTGKKDLQTWLIDNGLKSDPGSDDVVVAGGVVYVKDHEPEKIRRIVELFQRTDWIGAVFTRAKSPGSPEGEIAGTLSYDLLKWDHERAGDILVSANWSDEKNDNGFPGKTGQTGVAGHGTTSPYDIHNTLIVGGPSFKKQIRNNNSTGNVDIAPTLCALLGFDPAPSMQGRVLREILADGPSPNTLETGTKTHRVEVQWEDGTSKGRYALELKESVTDGHTYLDSTKVERN
jgi:predicted AlkP superfamily pyrophosphatase or phosphodiesterase